MKYKRWIALLLSAAMALSLFAAPGWAAETEAEAESSISTGAQEAPELPEERESAPETERQTKEDGTETCLWVNPGYELSAQEREAALAELEQPSLETQASTKSVTSVKAAGKYLRGQMKKRQKTVKLQIKSKKYLGYNIWNDVFDEAVKLTGDPSEGDYIYGNMLHAAGKWKWKYAKKKYTYTLSYKLTYASTADQEKKVDKEVPKLLKKLDLNKDSKFVKFHKVYNYLCDNVVYDDEGLAKDTNGCRSAYAALVKKKAVCQGYATLLCRLLNEVGVPCRYIAGTGYSGSSSGPHAWNIVKLGGKYYNVDATWDAILRQRGQSFEYFLLSDASFSSDHVRDSRFNTSAYYKACPMSAKDGTWHYWEDKYIISPTCTEEGLVDLRCVDCGDWAGEVEIAAPLGHDWQPNWDSAESFTDYFRVHAYCTRCGIVDPEWYYFDNAGNPLSTQSSALGAQSADDSVAEALAAAVREAEIRRPA